ncbi:hypothetical protein ACE3NQ_18260 [Paenibacillus terreus]|uniref:WxL domain-containing protein n=1 Tax=Paenibacillus terreus TaxID=1387834 RepID=A0ABV5BBZ3_9BACL
MKKQIAALLMSTSLVLPMAAVASAESSSSDDVLINATNSDSEVSITNLGPSGNDAYFASNPSVFTDKSNDSIIKPMDTDGQNMSYKFSGVRSNIHSKDPLPVHRYGKISLTLVQTTGPASRVPAAATYQFATLDGSLKSDAILVDGEVTSPAKTITFSNVPKGTASKPVYLFIVNKTSDGREISGNGYTN